MRGALAMVALLAVACVPSTQSTVGQFLYVVGCDAQVDKLDNVAGVKVAAFDLAQRTGTEQLFPVVQGAPDGCLAFQALYDAKASLFYTVVAVTNQPKPDATKDYRVLGFSVPDLKLVKQLPGGENRNAPPHLELEADTLKIHAATDWTLQSDLDLTPYAPDHRGLPNQVLERSGERFLLRIFVANTNELVLALADRAAHTLVSLQDLPTTVAPAVHLVPGGTAVLVEETLTQGAQISKTGTLVMFDATNGREVKRFSDSHIKDLYFLAVSPVGKAIYHSGETYWFLELGRKFTADPVTRPMAAGYPGLFFADK